MRDELIKIADAADVIVNGYAFQRRAQGISVLNLNRPDRAALMTETGDVLETNMDDIELAIVREYLLRNLKHMEA